MPEMLYVKFKAAHGEFKKGDYAFLPEPLVNKFLEKVEIGAVEPEPEPEKPKAKPKK